MLKKEEIPKGTPLKFPKPDPAQNAGKHRHAGTILLVNGEAGFVLIDSGPFIAPEAGTALKAMRNGVETGILAVGQERRGSHVVADIVTGEPRKGDQVFE